MLRLSHYSESVALKCALCWLLNPLPITVSSRGNAESVMSALVLLTLYALMKRWTKTAAFLYAVSVHVKIYPITYCLPIYFLLGTDFTERAPSRKPDDPSRRGLLRRAMELLYPTRDRFSLCVCRWPSSYCWQHQCTIGKYIYLKRSKWFVIFIIFYDRSIHKAGRPVQGDGYF